MPEVHCLPARRHDFVLFFDVTDGNPNGDPDGGNMPRVDPETMHGLVSDVCLKRKVRDFVHLVHQDQAPNRIFVQRANVLNTEIGRAHQAQADELKGKSKAEQVALACSWMKATYYDIRTFGAVMTTGPGAGQVRGPVQLTFARSVDPITPLNQALTRVAITKEQDAEWKETEMGSKWLVPYGLYRAHGFVNATLAAQTGFSTADLTLLWRALQEMWDHDHSAARGLMSFRGLYIFSHQDALGNAPAERLFGRVRPQLLEAGKPPRSIDAYQIVAERDNLPAGVTLTIL